MAFASNPAFDAATMEVWAPLLNGGRIVVVDRESFLDPRSFAQLLEQHGVTALARPCDLRQYAIAIPEALARLPSLRRRKKVDPSSCCIKLERYRAKHQVNCYGPTEAITLVVRDGG